MNLSHFQINYAVVFLLQMLFLKKNDDPNWVVSVGGMPMGKSVMFSAAFFCSILVLVHGILHPVPEADEAGQTTHWQAATTAKKPCALNCSHSAGLGSRLIAAFPAT
ncbi:PRA1 family protein F2 [Durusdinium trenchii]|uniref:PRA1 family protein F2 n=1 Tax=Durusdinium trenchii TaxID=1381693 RepID=A0ABP0RDW1_9DINO